MADINAEPNKNLVSNNSSSIGLFLKIISGLILTLFFGISGFIFLTGEELKNTDLSQFSDIDNGFIIKYPKNWQIKKDSSDGFNLVAFLNPAVDVDRKSNQAYFSNIQVMYHQSPVGQSLSLSELREEIIAMIKGQVDDFKIIDDGIDYINGNEVNYFIITYTLKEKDEYGREYVFNIKSKTVVLAKEKSGREFMVSASTLDSQWEKYSEVFEKSISSFDVP